MPVTALGQTLKTNFGGKAPGNYTTGGRTVNAPVVLPQRNASAAQTTAPPSSGQLLNISTRLRVQTGNNVLIGGFIITGTVSKKVIIRALGPSLAALEISDALANPILELRDGGGALIFENDNWKDAQEQAIRDTTIPPLNDLESAIVATLAPGNYTAIVRGKNGGTGVGLVEGYDLSAAPTSKLGNISTRGFVDTGDNVMVGGIIVGPTGAAGSNILVRAIGPSLTTFGIENPLSDPMLALHDSNGDIVAANDNWKDSQEEETEGTGIPPNNDKESALLATLAPGNYTAVVRGENNASGVALVEMYNLAPVPPLETENRLVNASEGGTITIPSGSRIIIPAGTFPADQAVSLSLFSLSSQLLNSYFETTGIFDAGTPSTEMFVVDTGSVLPKKEITVVFKVTDEYYASLPETFSPQLYVQALLRNEDETADVCEPIATKFDEVTKELTATIPLWAFTTLRQIGISQCVIVIGNLPARSGGFGFAAKAPVTPIQSLTETQPCDAEFHSPLRGISGQDMLIAAGNRFGERDDPFKQGEKQFHAGLDFPLSNYKRLKGPNASAIIVPVANGYVKSIGWLNQTGQVVIVQHDGYQTKYAHLEAGSINLQKRTGQAVEYPTASSGERYPTSKQVGLLKFKVDEIPVVGGVTPIGIIGNTGSRSLGFHLHLEYGKNVEGKQGRFDPFPCITRPAIPVYEGPFSGTEPFQNTYNPCTFQVAMSGNIAIALSQESGTMHGAARVTGHWSAAVTSDPSQCIPSEASFDYALPVSGTTSSLTFSGHDFPKVTFQGGLNGTSITGTAVFTFRNTTGSVSSPVTLTQQP